jgi:hypothetical protein
MQDVRSSSIFNVSVTYIEDASTSLACTWCTNDARSCALYVTKYVLYGVQSGYNRRISVFRFFVVVACAVGGGGGRPPLGARAGFSRVVRLFFAPHRAVSRTLWPIGVGDTVR